jgi:hypothetical protein
MSVLSFDTFHSRRAYQLGTEKRDRRRTGRLALCGVFGHVRTPEALKEIARSITGSISPNAHT